MRAWLLSWCCLLLWSCNARQCGGDKTDTATDTLTVAEQWEGTVHAVTCEDIEVKISFMRRQGADTGTYQMTQRCKDNNNTFRNEGEWYIRNGKEPVYVLHGGSGEATRYYKVKGSRLVELDADEQEVNTYYLERVE